MLSGPDPVAQSKTFSKTRRAPRNMEVHFRSNSSMTSDPGKSSNKVPDYYTEMLGFKILFSTTYVQRKALSPFAPLPIRRHDPCHPRTHPCCLPHWKTQILDVRFPSCIFRSYAAVRSALSCALKNEARTARLCGSSKNMKLGSVNPSNLSLCAILPRLCSVTCLAPVRCWLWSLNISIRP